ncbi:hypothetical protein IFM12275_24040 [Nocardia sputorum]|uniref:response regulator transcription factor n=1 Tax=Nocardia sputorum TaxID=2984338 RepID=UPI0024935B0B|nr:response regulator transcription factor [Nocardia sputorum]BDT92428.1 hypothetical protein IFM12275_24040 [Nocardia sputorum]
MPDADVVILDLSRIEHAVSLHALRMLTAQLPVLVISASDDPGHVANYLQTGAAGYLSLSATESAYLTAIRTVARGGLYVSSELAHSLRRTIVTPTLGDLDSVLSKRERETLACIARGLTHQQTARRMSVSKATVDTYVARVRTKLKVGNKAELTMVALSYLATTSTPTLDRSDLEGRG